ncbi:cation:proton antiporter domain-containing protein [Zobellella sp. An-6]|uniref:cation:proton antiporter domain-containing protein n=1 Tax=Zobellella sp. An-6 TaxID=3400218 RepID=UPI004043559C
MLVFQRLRIPPSLGYLLVGVLLGSHTAGPVLEEHYIKLIAEFGIVFLLFTIGLSFSLSQIYALRHLILGLGTAQVALTTAVVALLLWAMGMPGIAAFVIGAVFAQSSTTIISKQLTEQGEEQTRHGRLGTTLSVFQDITAVPFVIIIPVLGVAAAQEVAGALGIALVKALLAFAAVFLVGRYLLRPFFHLVSEQRSAELFTLTVLFVSLIAAWTTMSLGLSMAFGAFLAGMMLGETEFRHQVDSTIRPFRDVLLGLFFVSIGMLLDPALLPDIWLEALLGACALLLIKLLLVTAIVRWAKIDSTTAFRIGMILAVGGEFGFALLAIALDARVIAVLPAQIALTAVFFSMILAPFLIRFNQPLATWLFSARHPGTMGEQGHDVPEGHHLSHHVIVCGYGRIGQIVSRFLESERIPYIALDMDAKRVKDARLSGEPVFFADSADPAVLEAAGAGKARLLLISHDDLSAALKTLAYVRRHHPGLPIMVRTRDETHVEDLRAAGATEVIPETLEAGMMMASHAMLSLRIPLHKVASYIQQQRTSRYQMLRELFPGTTASLEGLDEQKADRLYPVQLQAESPAIGKRLAELELDSRGVIATVLVRSGKRSLAPGPDTLLQVGDVLVLFGPPDELEQVGWQLGAGQPGPSGMG